MAKEFDPIDDGDVFSLRINNESHRDLAKWRKSKSEWRREVARMIDEGILPLSSLYDLPREMRGPRPEPH
jgi:hypothetical protein